MSAERIGAGQPQPQGRGEDPLFHFTRIFLLFLQGLFKQFEAGDYRWSEDPQLSEISITDQIPVPRDIIEKRPAIVTMRGPAQFSNLSHDQMRTVDDRTGMKERSDLVACTMSINCIAKQGLEAQRLGWIVFSNVRNFKTLLQRAGLHKVGDEVSIGPESAPGSLVAPEPDTLMSMVTVQVPCFFQWTVRMTPLDAVNLREIEMHMDVQPVYAKTELRPPTVRGKPLVNLSVDVKTT
jgi:hypothetical protein